MRENESLDGAFGGAVRIIQPKKGYRFSVEAVLLAALTFPGSLTARVFDLGCGSGVIGLCLRNNFPGMVLTGIDVQESCVDRATRSSQLNGYGESCKFVACDVRDVGARFKKGCADLVVSNPPFRSPGSSRVSPDESLAVSRNEIFGALGDFALAAAHLLTSGGEFRVVYPAERIGYLLDAVAGSGLAAIELRFIHPRSGARASYALLTARKGKQGRMEVLPPIVLHPDTGDGKKYTELVSELIRQPVV